LKFSALWRDLFAENPMMAEIGRFRRRYLTFGGPSTQVNGGLGILLIGYAIFSIFCIANRGDVNPITVLPIFLIFGLFAVPLLLHATISGERERRSWDMLMVAPLTHAQIVVGKFVGAFLGVSLAFGVFLIPVVLTALYFTKFSPAYFFACLVVILGQLATMIALTILISARVKRPLTALGVTLLVTLIYFVFMPVVMGVAAGPLAGPTLTSVSPFAVIWQADLLQSREDSYWQSPSMMGVSGLEFGLMVTTFILFQLVLVVAFIAWAVKTLAFADNEVKFLPQTKKHARSSKSA
jgi:Cu-processing system permease protein